LCKRSRHSRTKTSSLWGRKTWWYYGSMAAIKMTFSVPDELAKKFVKRVPARERSRFLAMALDKSLKQEDNALVRACLAANENPDVLAIEKEWDAISDRIAEPWTSVPTKRPKRASKTR
jgi:hypothetical protein